jgi:hypothetical protein
MASNNLNVYAGEPLATGTVLVADLDTDGPTDAQDVLDVAFTDLGHVGEDGFTETVDRSIEKKKNWGGSVVKILQTDFTITIKFKLLESLNADVLKAIWGEDNVTVVAADATHGAQVYIKKTKKKLPKLSWVIDSTDSELEAFYRNYIPIGQIMTLGDVVIVHTDTIEYEVELEVFEDSTGVHIHPDRRRTNNRENGWATSNTKLTSHFEDGTTRKVVLSPNRTSWYPSAYSAATATAPPTNCGNRWNGACPKTSWRFSTVSRTPRL